jgi:hypothetical protein
MLDVVRQYQDQTQEDYRELPCRDFDFDCYGFDGIVPFGDYRRCEAYARERGRCIFLSCGCNGSESC